MREPDAVFADPRQAVLYDVLDDGRSDLDADEVLRSTSTLRFRDRDEVERDLRDHGFTVVDVRDAPDRPGKELVFLARARGENSRG